jgi:hypothetical protein
LSTTQRNPIYVTERWLNAILPGLLEVVAQVICVVGGTVTTTQFLFLLAGLINNPLPLIISSVVFAVGLLVWSSAFRRRMQILKGEQELIQAVNADAIEGS